MRLHARLATGGDIVGVAIGGQRDDRQHVLTEPAATQGSGCFQSVHVRHLHIHQHRIVCRSVALCLDHGGHRLAAILHEAGVQSQRFGHRHDQLLVDLVVFCDQDPLALQESVIAVVELFGLFGFLPVDRLQREANGETGPLSHFALDRNLPAHHAYQLAGDRQAQARPAVTPRDRSVFLREGFEDAPKLVGRNPDARIAYFDQRAPLHTVVLDGRVHAHGPALGEFHGIADQVHQHLAKPQTVGLHQLRKVFRHVLLQRDSLRPRLRFQQARAVADLLAHVGRFGMQFQLAHLDLRQVENVVQQVHHRAARIGDQLHVALLFFGKVRLQQHVGEADHAVHRGADFMAHVGQEIGLCRSRFLGPFARPLQIRFKFLGSLDVDVDADIAHQIAALIEFRRTQRRHPQRGSVGTQPAPFVAIAFAPGNGGIPFREHALLVFRMDRVGPAVANAFLLGPAGLLLQGLVYIDAMAVGRGAPDARGGDIGQRLEADRQRSAARVAPQRPDGHTCCCQRAGQQGNIQKVHRSRPLSIPYG